MTDTSKDISYFFTVVQVGFAQTMYTVNEPGPVSVCINVSGAVLDRNVSVSVSTTLTNDTASCELITHCV